MDKSKFFQLEPEVAGNMPHDKMWMTIPEVMRATGLSWEEMRAELIAGRLIAEGTPSGSGFGDVHIRCDRIVTWMAETNRQFVV